MAHYPPGHVLCERRGLLFHTNHLIDLLLPSSIKDVLVPGMYVYDYLWQMPMAYSLLHIELEFWSANKTLKALAEGRYFETEGDGSNTVRWPPTLQTVLGKGLAWTWSQLCNIVQVSFNLTDDNLGCSVTKEFELAVSALGACVWCLKMAHVDFSILSLASFQATYS